MRIKKYEAPSLPEALAKIKQEMGEAAVILKTRFNTDSSGRAQGKKSVEVTAAIDSTGPAVSSSPVAESTLRPSVAIASSRIPPEIVMAPRPEETAAGRQTPSELLGDIKDELVSLRESYRLAQNNSLFGQPAGIQIEIARKLVEKGLPETLAVDVVKRLSPNLGYHDIRAAWNEVRNLLESYLLPGEPVKLYDDKATVVLLLGPTGGGKTSAAARLAFHHSVEKNIPVTLFSTDTFRADSREQLRSLADMIGCPSLNITSPEQLTVALKSYRKGLIIIDTSGISHSRDLAELIPIIGAANPHETHLVIPANTPMLDIVAFTKAQSDLQIDKILVTKLDQSHCRGGLLGAARESGLKFSYQGASREMPGHFGLFDPEAFAMAFLPESETRGKEGNALEVVGW